MFDKQGELEPWDAFFERPALSFESQPRLRELFEVVARSTEPVTLFLGAGVSIDSGLPTWGQLIENLAASVKAERWADCIKDDPAEPLRKAEYLLQLAQEGNVTAPEEIVRDALYRGKEHPQPGSLADAIARVATMLTPSRVAVLTTNFDTLFETALRSHSPRTTVGTSSLGMTKRAIKALVKDGFSVHHVHGILEPNQVPHGIVVLTESQFLEHGPAVRGVIEAALMDSQVIFAGVSLTDPNLVTPLWKLKKEKKKYKEPFVITVASPPAGSTADPHDSRAFAIRKAAYLEKQLNVRTIFMKSFAQVPQLFHEMSLALADPDRYFDASPRTSTRYGHRLAAILDTAYRNIGCGPGDELPIGPEAAALSTKLHASLYSPGTGLVPQLRTLAAAMLNHNNPKVKKMARDNRESFQEEQFGLFLWLRSRDETGRRSEYDLRLVGTSVYTHNEAWSLDREAPIESGSRFDSANAAFLGQTHIEDLDEGRPWQLWRTGVAVPFYVTAGGSDAVLPDTGLNLDVLSIGVIALHTRNTIKKDGTGKLLAPGSILGALQPEQLTEVFTKLTEIASEAIGFKV